MLMFYQVVPYKSEPKGPLDNSMVMAKLLKQIKNGHSQGIFTVLHDEKHRVLNLAIYISALINHNIWTSVPYGLCVPEFTGFIRRD